MQYISVYKTGHEDNQAEPAQRTNSINFKSFQQRTGMNANFEFSFAYYGWIKRNLPNLHGIIFFTVPLSKAFDEKKIEINTISLKFQFGRIEVGLFHRLFNFDFFTILKVN